MPFKLIKGTFHVVSYSPDGDSIKFKPDIPALVLSLPGARPKILNPRGHCQLRIEAIDTLETHYNVPGATLSQPLKQAHSAIDRLMEFVGIRGVVWDAGHRTVTTAEDGTRGYILTRSVEQNNRPVAFVFAGDPPETDGVDINLDTDRLRESYNYAALAEGYAYPTFYEGLFHDLRKTLTEASIEARGLKRQVWEIDRTHDGFEVATLSAITEQHAILPKLFRRLSQFMVSAGTAWGFKAWLAATPERVLDLRNDNFTHFDTFVEEASTPSGAVQIRLTRQPEELVFLPVLAAPAALSALAGQAAFSPEILALSNELVLRLAQIVEAERAASGV
jgi:uncharacterized protein (DUF952 family)